MNLILHSLICRVLLLLLLLLLLRNASDLRNCTSYFGAFMWVWYCRPPVGAHFHPNPQPHPFPSNWGRKRFYVLWQQFQPIDVGKQLACRGRRRPAAGAGLRRRRLHTRGLAVERRLVQATAVRRSHSSCYYYYYYKRILTFPYCFWTLIPYYVCARVLLTR